MTTSAGYARPVLQRAGWLIQFAANETGKQIDLRSLASTTRGNPEPTPLIAGGSFDGYFDKTWNVIVNAELELD